MDELVYIPDEELEQYINYKLVESIISSDILSELKNNPSAIEIMQNGYFIDMLSMFVDNNVKTNRIDSKQKKNILDLVSILRSVLPLEIFGNTLNEIIISVNQSELKSNKYFANNLLNRFFKGDFFVCKVFKLTPQIIETIKTSIAMDYHYLVLLTTVSDEEFLSSLDSLSLDEFFYYSVNAFISEYKKILKDKLFLKRFSMVVKRNKELNCTIDNKEMIKMMGKYNKYYNRFLKGE